MYTNIKTILEDAAKNHYAVIATNPINMETARGIIAAASEKKAPIILLLGQNIMRRHAKAELLMPMIKTLAEYSAVPIAVCLDHGNQEERLLYSFRNGFNSIMYDGSSLPFEENIRNTKKLAELCHTFNMGIEGELGHVGVAANGDEKDVSLYTKPEDAAKFVKETNVDCLAIAVGTAHGEYPAGFVPHIDFDIIKAVKEATNGIPLALHGGSGSGDENILKAVKSGINKVNVVTDLFIACRNALCNMIMQDKKTNYMDLMIGMESAARCFTRHWIDLSGSAGKASNFHAIDNINLLSAAHSKGSTE